MSRGGNRNAHPTAAELRAGWAKNGRALDFDIAVKVMGWTPKYEPPAYDGWVDGYCYWKGEGAPTANGGMWTQWQPATNLNQCRLAEQRIIELGQGEEYAAALARELGVRGPLSFAIAPAEARCKAMLSVLEGA